MRRLLAILLVLAVAPAAARPADGGQGHISVGAAPGPSRLPGGAVHGSIIPRGQRSIIPRGEHDRAAEGRGWHRHGRPQVIYVVPRQCVSPGYWAYQWLPSYQVSSVYVPGQWGADGNWIEAHYQAQTATSGIWQPYWVPEQRYAC